MKLHPLNSSYYLATIWNGREKNIAVKTTKRYDVSAITPNLESGVDLQLSHLSEYEYRHMQDRVPSLILKEAEDAAHVKQTLKTALKRFYEAY
jgi:hypothetical protein